MSVYSLLTNAISDPNGSKSREAGYYFLFSGGDLSQLSSMGAFLRAKGFDVGFCNVYPAVKTEEDYKHGLELVWKEKANGWWHYCTGYVKHGICTKEEFTAALNRI